MPTSLSPNSAKSNNIGGTERIVMGERSGGGATAPPVDTRVEGIDGHYNRITKQWEESGSTQYVVSSVQNGSTFPEEIGYVSSKPSFKDQLFKKFGKSSNKDELPRSREPSDHSAHALLRKSIESTNTLVEPSSSSSSSSGGGRRSGQK